jgi:glyoxylase-like metal-dependent hydrolase (beta-lactamase superfamily II)
MLAGMETTTLAPQFSSTDEFDASPRDVTYLTTVLVNVCFVGEPHPRWGDWVLIDTGIPMNTGRIASFAEERFGPTPPRAILLTHGHFDHVGSLHALLRRWPETPVYAHRLELPYLTGHSAYPPPDPTVGGGFMARTSPLFPRHAYNFRPNIMPLSPDGVVPFLPDWRWIHTPGHSPGHVSFFRESDRTLLAGDAFITQEQESLWGVMSQKHVVHGPPTYFTTDWEAARESVQRLADLKPNYAITGHGLPVSNPRLAHDLHLLSTRFNEFALPEDGRYVRHAARSDERGTVWVPPAVRDVRPKVIGGIALAAAAVALTRAYMRRQRD